METQECLSIRWLFLHVTTEIELSIMMDLTRQLGTAGKEELLTYWSQKTKGSLPRPDKKILTMIIHNQEMRIHCYWKERTATVAEWEGEMVKSLQLVLE